LAHHAQDSGLEHRLLLWGEPRAMSRWRRQQRKRARRARDSSDWCTDEMLESAFEKMARTLQAGIAQGFVTAPWVRPHGTPVASMSEDGKTMHIRFTDGVQN
jgi:N-formylglutamate amidohydrolase